LKNSEKPNLYRIVAAEVLHTRV